MIDADVPTKFTLRWAQDAGGSYIRVVPTSSQIGIQDGAASFHDGFVPVNFVPPGAGGTPPFGQDMNGILNAITAWNQWQQAGAPIKYDGTFQTAIGGYPRDSVVWSATVADKLWLSIVDGNTTNPDTGGAGWRDITPGVATKRTGSGSIVLPSAGAAAGTVGSQGTRFDSGGNIYNWAYIQLEDFGTGSTTPVSWSFPTPFPNHALGVTTTNFGVAAGQGAAAGASTASVTGAPSTSGIGFNCHSYQSGAPRLIVFYVEVWGY